MTALADRLLRLNPDWVDPSAFDGLEWFAVDDEEPFAANALRIGSRVVYPEGFRCPCRRSG